MAAREKQRREANGGTSNQSTTDNAASSSAAPATSTAATAGPSYSPIDVKESVDLLGLSCIERKQLAHGGRVDIYIGNTLVRQLHHNLVVATSSKGATLIDHNGQVHLRPGCSEAAVMHIINWIDDSTRHNHIQDLRLVRLLSDTIELYRAAKELGMIRYVLSIIDWHRRNIWKTVPSNTDIARVENAAADAHDIFVQIMGDRVAYLVRHNQLPVDDYMGMVQGFPKVYEAYLTLNAQWIQRRNERAQKKIQAKQERAKQRHLRKERQARQQREERLASERETAEIRAALLPKLNQKIISLTPQEREDALWFKEVCKDPAFAMVI
jgi:hypothetical protein